MADKPIAWTKCETWDGKPFWSPGPKYLGAVYLDGNRRDYRLTYGFEDCWVVVWRGKKPPGETLPEDARDLVEKILRLEDP